jgi:hypothetical protein
LTFLSPDSKRALWAKIEIVAIASLRKLFHRQMGQLLR